MATTPATPITAGTIALTGGADTAGTTVIDITVKHPHENHDISGLGAKRLLYTLF